MIIVANRDWSDSHANASRSCSSVGWHRNESLCTISKEKTRRALKILRFVRHFSATRTYLDDNREHERGPIVSVGVDPTGTFWSRLATFHVSDQITIATRRQTSICPSCESPIKSLLTKAFTLKHLDKFTSTFFFFFATRLNKIHPSQNKFKVTLSGLLPILHD